MSVFYDSLGTKCLKHLEQNFLHNFKVLWINQSTSSLRSATCDIAEYMFPL